MKIEASLLTYINYGVDLLLYYYGSVRKSDVRIYALRHKFEHL